MKKILISLSIVAAAAAVVAGGTFAYFSDTETSTGNTFTAGTLDLKLGGGDSNITMFSLTNKAPGNSGGEEVTLNNAGSLNGFIDFDFSNLVNAENGCNEPEKAVDATCEATGDPGELAANLDITAYIDKDGSNTFNLGDVSVYQGKANGIISAGLQNYPFASSATDTFRIDWSIGIGVGNEIQSDSAGFDITFELGQTDTTQ